MIKERILAKKTYLGIEPGTTRIKASLVGDTYTQWEWHFLWLI